MVNAGDKLKVDEKGDYEIVGRGGHPNLLATMTDKLKVGDKIKVDDTLKGDDKGEYEVLGVTGDPTLLAVTLKLNKLGDKTKADEKGALEIDGVKDIPNE